MEGDILRNITKHEPYLDKDYKESQKFKFVQSDEEGDNAAFSIINPSLFDLDLEKRHVGNADVVSTITGTLLLSEKFYEIFSFGWRSTATVQFYVLCIALQISGKE